MSIANPTPQSLAGTSPTEGAWSDALALDPALLTGLPDETTLSKIASELFNVAPSAPVSGGGIGLSLGSAPLGLANLPNVSSQAIPAVAASTVIQDASATAEQSSLIPATIPELPYQEVLTALFSQHTLSAPHNRVGLPPSASSRINNSTSNYYFLDPSKLPAHSIGVSTQRSVQVPTWQEAHKHQALPTTRSSGPELDFHAIRGDFPILKEKVNGRSLVWLDNAATTQKPQSVIDRVSYFYEHENSNIHRAAHELAARATDAYEGARETVKRFINAGSVNEIVFVRGTTEAINLVAQSWGRQHIKAGDEIIITWLEHHANIVPWQMLCAEKGAYLRVAPVDDNGQVILEAYEKLLSPRTKLVSFTQVSNALGTITPAKQMIEMAHRHGAKVLLDGAQSVSHMRADVQALNCDWFVFSGHKVFGPTGIGALYGREDLLNATQPWQGGGNMIVDVTFEKTIYHQAPGRFEAGTGNIADAVGLGAALDYVMKIGIDNIAWYEHQLLQYATKHLSDIPGLKLIGTAPDKAGVLSFILPGFRTEEVGSALNQEGIAVRSGHHCAQPILRRFGLETTVRPSLAVYNNCADIDALVAAIRRLQGGQRPIFDQHQK